MSTATPAEEAPVDIEAMAKYLGKSEFTTRKLARNGDIPGFKVGREWRFYVSAVREHLTRPATWNQSPQSRGRKRISA